MKRWHRRIGRIRFGAEGGFAWNRHYFGWQRWPWGVGFQLGPFWIGYGTTEGPPRKPFDP